MEMFQFEPAELSILERSCIPFAIYQFIDSHVVTLTVSDGFLSLYGLQDREEAIRLMSEDMYRDTHPEDAARVAEAALRFAREDTEYDIIYRVMLKGEYRIIHSFARHITKENGARLGVVWYTDEGVYDEKDRFRQGDLKHFFNSVLRENSIYRSNTYDTLTGLPGMGYFFELAEAGKKKLQADGKMPVMLFFDLNGMSYFNSKYGFAEGDQLIRAFGRILARHFGNECCSRFAQDRFAAFCDIRNLEKRLMTIFNECLTMNDGRTLPVRCGIYKNSTGDVGASTACDRAKYACEFDKSSHISSFRYFDEEMLEDAAMRQYIIDSLDRAIEEGWITVYYQPVIRAASGRVCSEEALARWIDPEKGLILPDIFVQLLADGGICHKMDLYVVEQVLQKMKVQENAGLYVVPESVNLCREDFDECDMVHEIAKRVDAAGVERSMLIIELSESAVGKDTEFMKQQIQRFNQEGFSVWLDDFGGGHSSLDVIRNIPFELVKLDARYMQQFQEGEKGRIVLTELVKIAVSLGMDASCEGVETLEQVEFLKEIGCTKLQGYYFCDPIPLEKILERYETGTQIGFENPAEADYYAALGRINLYDFSFVVNEAGGSFDHYFDTLPMAILECDQDTAAIIRCNKSYREFMNNAFGISTMGHRVRFDSPGDRAGTVFMNSLRQCARDGRWEVMDERLNEKTTVHTFIRRVAVNPVTGIAACATVILGLMDEHFGSSSVFYAHIAQALSADYFNLYYVNLDTDQFIEYSSSSANGNLAMERHGEDFFNASHTDAMVYIYSEDRAGFLEAFTKENIIQALNEHGTFTLSYRLMVDKAPVYVNMKIVRINADGNYIIIGVNNVDAQMKHQEELERIKEERITYSRITALAGDYIVIYTVDPVTDYYIEYSATKDYEGLGFAKRGYHFFEAALEDSRRAVYLQDQDMFQSMFNKEKIMEAIRVYGLFTMNYRLLIDGEPQYVCLKAAMVEEKNGPQLIVGVVNVDAQVRRDQEYASTLTEARNMANLDQLTGVKNKHAYVDAEAQLNRHVEEKLAMSFAIVVLDVNGLKLINDTKGHQAGDRYLMDACEIICRIFKHSPVFRVGGDEFAIIAQGLDYDNIDGLMGDLADINEENRKAGKVVVAGGMARYNGDRSVAAVFERADALMYENKKMLKKCENKKC